MQNAKPKLILTDWLETSPNSRRDFLAKVGKGALLVSLGMFGAGCETVNRGIPRAISVMLFTGCLFQ
ncbi:hypothetical protein J4G08_03905 [Candidatus Poribacteria bacterium]|nr:hypothetical protein [Candidatus Poribacteria bacterium]